MGCVLFRAGSLSSSLHIALRILIALSTRLTVLYVTRVLYVGDKSMWLKPTLLSIYKVNALLQNPNGEKMILGGTQAEFPFEVK